MNKYEKLKIHSLYVVVILTVSLIFMLVHQWTPEPRFTEYLGNVATMVSLVLALVAIFYSFISNDGLSKSLGGITAVTDSLNKSEQEINVLLDQSRSLTEGYGENVKTMQGISSVVENNIQKLSSAIEDISIKTTELQATVHGFSPRLDALDTKLKGDAPPVEKSKRNAFSVEEAKYFNRYSSVAGNFVTYACVQSQRDKKEFELAQLEKITSYSTDRIMGFLDCMRAAGIIKLSNTKRSVAFVEELDSEVANDVRAYLDKFSAGAEEATKLRILGCLTEIDNMFAAIPPDEPV